MTVAPHVQWHGVCAWCSDEVSFVDWPCPVVGNRTRYSTDDTPLPTL